MRALALAFASLIPLACHSRAAPPAPSSAASSSLTPEGDDAPAYRDLGHWTGAEGVEWHALVIAPETTHKDLMELARRLRYRAPTTFFDLYDDGAELPKLIAARGNDDALPEEWRQAHAVATIAGAVSTTEEAIDVSGVTLFEWRTGATTKLP